MTLFDAVPTAKATFQANYIKAGHYVVRIDAIKYGNNRKKEEMVVIEMTIAHIFEGDQHKVEEEVSKVYNSKHDMTPGNLKAMFAALLGREPESVPADQWKKICMKIVGEQQPLRGMFSEIKARNTVTKSGQDYTIVNYGPAMKSTDKRLLEILDAEECKTFLGVEKPRAAGTAKGATAKAAPEAVADDDDDVQLF